MEPRLKLGLFSLALPLLAAAGPRQAYQLAGPPFTQPLRLPHHAHRRAPVRGR